MPSDKYGCMNFHGRMHMTVQMLVKTIWFAVLLYLFTSLVLEDVLALMAECSWIYSLSSIFPDFTCTTLKDCFFSSVSVTHTSMNNFE